MMFISVLEGRKDLDKTSKYKAAVVEVKIIQIGIFAITARLILKTATKTSKFFVP
jgi:hypothetical protein